MNEIQSGKTEDSAECHKNNKYCNKYILSLLRR